ncbi:MAG TPA: hypothetical protein VFX38_05645, partial [Gammaproteobacteria bacterium]|nr:hypothetical protein [Gammaproteobacteria bacterium]
MNGRNRFFRSSRRLLGQGGLLIFGMALMAGTVASPAAAASGKAVTYAPPDMSEVSAAELKNYYAWREHMDWLLAPIHTRADLEKYLKETEKSASPLDALAPDARRRLLSEIQFGPAGAFVVSYADLQYLSTEQVYKILALFGQQNWALRFTGGKIRAASPQPKSSSTQESIVQRRFDEYWKATQSVGESSRKQAQLVGDKYDQLFSPLQNPARLRSLPSGDLRLLLRAAFLAAGTTSNAKYAADAQMDFAEMERRHFAGWPDYDAMFQSLVLTRQFAAARQFSLAHPDADSAPFPEYRDEAGNAGKNTPTVLAVSTTGNELVRRPVDLDRPALLLILTDPHCYFCAQFEAA